MSGKATILLEITESVKPEYTVRGMASSFFSVKNKQRTCLFGCHS